MSDNYNDRENSVDMTNTTPNTPVNGEYHYHAAQLEDLQRPQEPRQEESREGQPQQEPAHQSQSAWQTGPQASFGSGDWQWTPAEPQPAPKPKRKIRWGRIGLSALGIVLAAALCFGAGYSGVLVAQQRNTVVIQQVSGGSGDGGSAPAVSEGSLTSAQVAAKVEASVVAITTEQMTTSSYWFGSYVTSGAGSGVIISEDGYIITCAHVIDGASKITVELSNGETALAQLVGSYTNGDIAVIKIDKTGLTAAEIADSDQVLQGETCYAVGNPEGRFSGSISDGIVSALNRSITVQVESASGSSGNSLYDMFYGGGTTTKNIQLTVLQMTAAVSPGNSGGALFNDRGQLIGIVSAKSSDTDSEGLGFAIPSNRTMEIASQLIASGSFTESGDDDSNSSGSGVTATSNKAILGITVSTITQQQAYQYNMTPGVYVSEITVQSTADAGLAVGDRIVSVDDVMVTAATDVTDYLADKAVGDQVTLNVERSGRLVRVTVTLVENTTIAD